MAKEIAVYRVVVLRQPFWERTAFAVRRNAKASRSEHQRVTRREDTKTPMAIHPLTWRASQNTLPVPELRSTSQISDAPQEMTPSLPLFAITIAAIVWSAWCMWRMLRPSGGPFEAGLLAYGIALVPLYVLGFTGFLAREGLATVYLVLAVTATVWYWRWRRGAGDRHGLLTVGDGEVRRPRQNAVGGAEPFAWGVLVVWIALLVLHGYAWLCSSPAPAFRDDLIYHLYFPACWLQDHAISIVPQPFGDPAPAYYPCATELLLCLPLGLAGSDMCRLLMQWSYVALCAMGILRLAESLGGSRGAGALAAVSFLLAEPVVWGVRCHVAEVALSCFLTWSLVFVLEFWERRDWGSHLLLCVSLGLLMGTKVTGLALSLPILLAFGYCLFLCRRVSMVLSAVAVIAALGGPFYVRNLIVVGNPLYPLDWSLFGLWHFDGAYGLDAMKRSAFHIADAREHVQFVAESLGTPFTAYALLCLPVWIWWAAQRGFARPRVWLVAIQAVWAVTMFFWVLPHNSQVRLLMPAMPLWFLVWIPVLRRARAPARKWIEAGSGILLLFAFSMAVKHRVEWLISPSAPAWQPLLRRAIGLAVVTTLTALALMVLAQAAARIRWMRRGLLGLGGATLLSIWPLGERYVHESRYSIFERSYGPLVPLVWRRFDSPERLCTIAYTGQNIPYPFTGRAHQNRVRYVNVSGAQADRFHDFHRSARHWADWHLSASHKPAYYRRAPDVDQWLRNLGTLGADYLAIYRLNAAEAAYIEHDAEGFPIEAMWAEEWPHVFRPVVRRSRLQVFEIVRESP